MHNAPLTSAQNPKIKHLKKLITHTPYRKETGLFVLEHSNSITEIVSKTPQWIDTLIIRSDSPFASQKFPIPTLLLSPKLWTTVSTLPQSPGLMAILHRPHSPTLDTLQKYASFLVGLDHIQDPQNVGAIIRSATAFGCDGILLFNGCADPYHPQSLRAMAGIGLTLPILDCNPDTLLQNCKSWQIISLDAHAKTSLSTLTPQDKTILLLGSEGKGLSPTLKINPVQIPIHPLTDSLNVGVAAGIALFYLRTDRI